MQINTFFVATVKLIESIHFSLNKIWIKKLTIGFRIRITNAAVRDFIIMHITSLKMNLFPNMLQNAHCG